MPVSRVACTGIYPPSHPFTTGGLPPTTPDDDSHRTILDRETRDRWFKIRAENSENILRTVPAVDPQLEEAVGVRGVERFQLRARGAMSCS